MAMKTFVTGEVLTASDTNIYLANTIFARKSTTESVTLSTTLQDDNDLTVSVVANSIYEVELQIRYDGHIDGDLRFAWATLPAGAIYRGGLTYPISIGDTLVSDNATHINVEDTDLAQMGAMGAGTTLAANGSGLLVMSSTAGTFKLQWAQNTSNGTATRLFANSYMALRRVD